MRCQTVAKTTLCRQACPADIDVPRYIRYIRQGRFDEALAVIREKIPFPLVCGYACVHPCEVKCARNQLDEAVAIRLLKRTAAEKGGDAWKGKAVTVQGIGKKVAVIGAGPTGLTAAYYLARRGYEVTVFEALPEPGGMMRYGIPDYRLPREVLDREIEEIRAAGVEIKTNSRVDSFEKLLAAGYDAVLLACGAWRAAKLGIEGEDAPGVLEGLNYLREANTGKAVNLGKKVAVIGGGNTAIDAARTAVRMGAKDVTILYRRTKDEMPASREEIEGALEEEVKIEFLVAPLKINKKGETLELICQRMKLGPKDKGGRPQPIPMEGSEFSLEFETIIVAIGQVLESTFDLAVDDRGFLQVQADTLETSQKGIFAGGDAVSGPSSIIEAIAQGRKAASSIDKFLGGTGIIDEKLAPCMEEVAPDEILPRGASRPFLPTIPLSERFKGFEAVELGYDESAAAKEAGRCLACDLRDFKVEVDGKACKECGYCMEACTLGVFAPADYFNDRGYKPVVAAHSERCIGCLACFYVCPDFAIDIQRVR